MLVNVCLYICIGHGVVIVVCSPWYRPSSILYSFSSSLVSCNYVCQCVPLYMYWPCGCHCRLLPMVSSRSVLYSFSSSLVICKYVYNLFIPIEKTLL